ncbi:MAG: hypothetical protein V7647_3963 [Acidobacteriota bacterium]|jgi:hypothetical protein
MNEVGSGGLGGVLVTIPVWVAVPILLLVLWGGWKLVRLLWTMF